MHLLKFIDHSFDLTKAVQNIYVLCKNLKEVYVGSTYSRTLKITRNYDPYEGIRLEACRSLSDILLMGANAYQENIIALNDSNPYMESRRVYTSEFPVLKKEVFQRSTESVFEYLLRGSDKYSHPFHSCMNKSEIVKAAMTESFAQIHLVMH